MMPISGNCGLWQGYLPAGSETQTTNLFPMDCPTAANSNNFQAQQPALHSSQNCGSRDPVSHYQLSRDTASKTFN